MGGKDLTDQIDAAKVLVDEYGIDPKNPNQLKVDHDTAKRYLNNHTIHLKAGDRIAQLLLIPVIKAQWRLVDEFSNTTDRAEGGFGSTGK